MERIRPKKDASRRWMEEEASKQVSGLSKNFEPEKLEKS
jgi:hypothetical protein